MINIKPANAQDLEIIHRLAYEIWPFAYGEILSTEQLKYMLESFYSVPSLQHQQTSLKHEFIIVFENETPIGFASFSAHADNASIYHLNKIYVLPRQQGKNIGKQLLEHVIGLAKENGGASLQLNVNRNNKALKFYEKQGFTVIRTEDIDIGEGYFMNDYVMELEW
jgi:ribosomal protein S18 acetylase RimI-like enzyme